LSSHALYRNGDSNNIHLLVAPWLVDKEQIP
jgi:hypothetical protein